MLQHIFFLHQQTKTAKYQLEGLRQVTSVRLTIIGVSLSEPPTIVTALRTHVYACLLVWTNHILNESIQIFYKD